jgi:hypothetical protein
MKTCGGAEIYLHHSYSRHQLEVSGLFHVPAALPLGKSLRYPIYLTRRSQF